MDKTYSIKGLRGFSGSNKTVKPVSDTGFLRACWRRAFACSSSMSRFKKSRKVGWAVMLLSRGNSHGERALRYTQHGKCRECLAITLMMPLLRSGISTANGVIWLERRYVVVNGNHEPHRPLHAPIHLPVSFFGLIAVSALFP